MMTESKIMPSSLSIKFCELLYVKKNWKSSFHSLLGIRIFPRDPITSPMFFLMRGTGSSTNR